MDLFWILLLVQLLGLIAVGIMLRRNLPASIDTIINKNSTRSDGSFSKGRFQQEKESINRWLKCVDGGLVFVFLATTFSAMITADFEVPLLNVGGLLWEKDPTVFIEPSSEMPFPEMQWPLVAVYAVSSFLLAPTVILPLYYKSLQNYRARANARFLDYYRQGFEQAREPPSVAN
jgi:hypothetical protein